MQLSPPVVILFIAASGFYFSTQCYLFKYRVARESGHRLYLTAVTVGVCLLLLTEVIFWLHNIIWFNWLDFDPIFSPAKETIDTLKAVGTLPLAFLLSSSINNIDDIREKSLFNAWQKNDVDSLCAEAITDFKPISVTLDTRKVYIGLVYDSLEPEKEGYLTILPLYSGYRDKDTLEQKLDKKYVSVYALLEFLENEDHRNIEYAEKSDELSDYRIVLPRERIVSLNISANLLYNVMEEPNNSF